MRISAKTPGSLRGETRDGRVCFATGPNLKTSNTFKAALNRFARCEAGSYTIESVIWLPIYVFVLALMMNISMVFFNESQILRVVQDSNRSFAVGRISSLEAAEQYVIDRIAYL